MRIFLISLILFISVSELSSKKIIYSEDFDSSNSLPPGFEIINNDGQVPVVDYFKSNDDAWIVGEIPYEPGNNFAITSSRYDNGIQADDWLITPEIQLTQNNYLIWRARNSSNQEENWESYEVLISEGGTDIENDFTMVYASKPQYNFEYPKISLEDFAGKTIRFAFRGVGTQGWMLFVDDIEILELSEPDISLDFFNLPSISSPAEIEVDFGFTNWGLNPVVGLKMNVAINGVSVNSQVISSISLKQFNSFSSNIKLDFTNNGPHVVKAWVELPNGKEDTDHSNDTITTTINIISGGTERNVLLESFTGTWCGNCPRSHVEIKRLIEKYPNLIPVEIHGGSANEPMLTEDGEEIIDQLNPAFPNGIVDRYQFDRKNSILIFDNEFEKFIQERLNIPSPVQIEIENIFDPDSRHLQIIVKAEFISAISGDFAFNAYVIENHVTGDTRYDQANYYSNSPEYPDLYRKGNPIKNYSHQHVLRDMLGGTWGEAHENLPMEINAGEIYEYIFNTVLNDEYDEEEIEIIAYIINNSDGRTEVLNANSRHLDWFTSVGENNYGKININPNPINDVLHISLSSESLVQNAAIYNLNGELIHNLIVKEKDFTVNTTGWSEGIYFICLKGKRTINAKFVIVR